MSKDAETVKSPAELAEVTLTGAAGSKTFALAVPRSLGVRYEITYAAAESEIKAVCAALGVCNASLLHKIPWTKKSSALGHGADVLEYLLSEGVAYRDILNAGKVAWVLVSRGLIPAREVADAEVFSEAPSERSTV